MYGKNILNCIYIHMLSESIYQFYSFSIVWIAIDSGKQYYKDIIKIEFWNNINKKTKIIFKLEFLISQYQ